jgi:hypothetical protein
LSKEITTDSRSDGVDFEYEEGLRNQVEFCKEIDVLKSQPNPRELFTQLRDALACCYDVDSHPGTPDTTQAVALAAANAWLGANEGGSQ